MGVTGFDPHGSMSPSGDSPSHAKKCASAQHNKLSGRFLPIARRLFGVQKVVFAHELLPRFPVHGINGNAGHRAQLHALRFFEVTDAFGTFIRIDDVDALAQRDGAVRTLRLANIAIDAFFGDHQGHGLFPSHKSKSSLLSQPAAFVPIATAPYRHAFMGLFLLKRLAGLAVTLLVASMVVFAALEILPGNAAQVMLGPDAAPAAVQALERQLGLDQPAIVRYGQWIGGLLHGNMGISYAYGSQASHMIAGSLALTIPLALLALFLACIMALAGGMYAAARHRRAGDAWMMALSQLGMAIPGFWLAMLLILVFSVRLRWFAAGGFDGWGSHPVQWLRSLKSLVLPALALSLVQAAVLMRITRAAMLEVLQEDFVRTARARGLSPRAVLFRHVLRNALIPVLTLSGLQFANLLAGAIVVENVFFLPGLGRLLFQSIANRDLVVVRNGVLVLATLVILVNAGVDLLQALVDPRLRQPQRAEEGSGA